MKKYIISSLFAVFCLSTVAAQGIKEDQILHKTLDELKKDLGKPISEETTWGGGIATFKLSDSLYYSCYFKYPDSKCHQYTVSDSNPSANIPNLNADAISSEVLENAFRASFGSDNPSGSAGYGTWDLGGRDMIGELPRPTYNVQEEGRVVVTITVDPNGNVIEASINNRTNTTNKQLRNAAIEAARKIKFNPVEGKNNQTGTITYYFKLK